MLKQLLSIIVVMAVSTAVFSQDVELAQDHPDQYVVVKGDTLWDISARFLDSPWLWPQIWQANPQVDNPHLIYPGDVINLVFIDGKPRLMVNRGGHPTVKLGPTARTQQHDKAINTIPLSKIERFLTKNRLLNKDELDKQAYIVGIDQNRIMATDRDRIYVRGFHGTPGKLYAIYRPTIRYRDVPGQYPWAGSAPRKTETKQWTSSRGKTIGGEIANMWEHVQWSYLEDTEILGYEITEIARTKMISSGDPATFEVVGVSVEVRKGDLVLPIFDQPFDLNFFPHTPNQIPKNMRIIALNEAVKTVAKNQVVALNRGSNSGVEAGQVYTVMHPGETVFDDVAYSKQDYRLAFSRKKAMVDLPDEESAKLMIFKTFDQISYGIIMDSKRNVYLHDYMAAP
ncbi:MAG: LysM peptidoglycan-binding domain-containing protein [bacterium]